MALMTWTKEQFGTDVPVCDEQHQKIFAMVNQLYETAATGDRNAVGKLLDELIDYVVMHFQTEEKLMQEKGYSGYAAHKEEHDKMVATCADLQKKFHAGQAEVTQDTARFVCDWLLHHVPKVDRPYGPALSS
ncbi:MAG: bacteriohemerythrin [Methylohalobius sp.]